MAPSGKGSFGSSCNSNLRNLIAKHETSLFQAPQRQLIDRHPCGRSINEIIQIRVFHAQLDQQAMGRMQIGLHESVTKPPAQGSCPRDDPASEVREAGRLGIIVFRMTSTHDQFRLVAATGIHRGDRAYQQDQVEIMVLTPYRGACWQSWQMAWVAKAAAVKALTRSS
jgi:hypothetical protein